MARFAQSQGGRARMAALLAAALATADGARAGAGDGGLETNEAALARQVDRLTEALALSRAREDRLAAALERGAYGETGVEPLSAGPVRVSEVDRERRLAVLDAGRESGLSPGLRLVVLRGDRAVARLRVIEVRGAISGALVEVEGLRSWPQPGDRVMLAGDAVTTGE